MDTSHTRSHGGSGLGLVICRGYIDGMKGKIWAESEEGKRTTFFFTIPKVS
ncbi:MAG: ATP-binding protein [Nitrosopumilus sp.]|nr:ATP-binding protein [Nitrosopumilus sp.]